MPQCRGPLPECQLTLMLLSLLCSQKTKQLSAVDPLLYDLTNRLTTLADGVTSLQNRVESTKNHAVYAENLASTAKDNADQAKRVCAHLQKYCIQGVYNFYLFVYPTLTLNTHIKPNAFEWFHVPHQMHLFTWSKSRKGKADLIYTILHYERMDCQSGFRQEFC